MPVIRRKVKSKTSHTLFLARVFPLFGKDRDNPFIAILAWIFLLMFILSALLTVPGMPGGVCCTLDAPIG